MEHIFSSKLYIFSIIISLSRVIWWQTDLQVKYLPGNGLYVNYKSVVLNMNETNGINTETRYNGVMFTDKGQHNDKK